MNIQRKQFLQTIFFLLIGVVLAYVQINKLTAEQRTQALESIEQANFFLIGLAMFVALLSHLFRALRWTQIIEAAGEKVKKKDAFFAVMIGYLMNVVIPRSGEVIRCVALARKEQIKVEKLIGTVIAERILDFIIVLLVITLTLVLQFDFLFTLLNEKLFSPFVKQFSTALPQMIIYMLIAILSLLAIFFIAKYVLQKETKIIQRVKQKWKDIKHNFIDGFKAILNVQNKTLFFLYTIGMWVAYFFISFILFKSVKETQHLGIDAGLSVLTSGSLGLLIPTPGGLGSYHQFVSNTLQLYNVSEGIGVSLSWLIWLTNFVIILLVGILSFALINIKLNK